MAFTKLCPTCTSVQSYSTIYQLKRNIKLNIKCAACSLQTRAKQKKRSKDFSKTCNKCNHISYYISSKGLDIANKNNRCKSCVVKEIHDKDPDRMKGENNPMFGTNLKTIWITKLGEENAIKKLDDLSEQRSINATGENNPMFGKPPGKSAGRGISGTYKFLHFRSSYELAFLIKFEKEHGVLPINAETLNFKSSGDGFTCVPDFYYDNVVYEIKPTLLLDRNDHKFKALEEMCRLKGYTFKIITENYLDLPPNIKNWIMNLYKMSIIEFTEKQYARFLRMK